MKYKKSYWWWQRVFSTSKKPLTDQKIRDAIVKSHKAWKNIADVIYSLGLNNICRAQELYMEECIELTKALKETKKNRL